MRLEPAQLRRERPLSSAASCPPCENRARWGSLGWVGQSPDGAIQMFLSSLRDLVPFLAHLPRTYVRGYFMPPLRG
jgi:hypothetical protein